jgi:hypothetical protein
MSLSKSETNQAGILELSASQSNQCRKTECCNVPAEMGSTT